jgi:hypothetical protein
MPKRYYNLEKETKAYLKGCDDLGISNQENIKVINDYVIGRKNENKNSDFLSKSPIMLKNLSLWLDASIPDSYPAGDIAWKDLSNNKTNLSFVSNPIYTKEGSGNLVFDGVDDYAQIASVDSLNFGTSPFTLCFVTYRTAFGAQGGSFINKGSTTSTGWGSRDSLFNIHSSLGEIARCAFSPTSFVWQHHTIVVQQNSSPYIKYYRNGVLFATSADALENPARLGSVSNTANLQVAFSNAGGLLRYFKGSFPLVQIYNSELNLQQIEQNFKAVKYRFGL